MPEFEQISGDENSGSFESGSYPAIEPEKFKPIGELLRGAKQNAPSGAFTTEAGQRIVNPRRAWSDERKAAARARYQAKRASTGNGATEDQSRLEVGGPVDPPKPKPQPSKDSVSQLSELLFMSHLILAKVVKADELQLTRQESADLGTASANVLRHYEWGGVAEKTKDWLVFIGCCGMVYMPKLDALKARRNAQRKAKQVAINNPTGGIRMAEPPPVEVHDEIPDTTGAPGFSGHFATSSEIAS